MVEPPTKKLKLTRISVGAMAILLASVVLTTFSFSSGAQPVQILAPQHNAISTGHTDDAVRGREADTPTTTPPTPVAKVPASTTPAVTPLATVPTPAVPAPSVATLVSEVEATGVEPGSNWSWSMGNTATHCGVITGIGTGCTFGAAGLEQTIFSGLPTLALVAHELGNAETQNDAVPSLLNEVAAAENGTSWSPTDAVASCLVEHFMGFQDDAAGSWQCPPALATVVAQHIHDTIQP